MLSKEEYDVICSLIWSMVQLIYCAFLSHPLSSSLIKFSSYSPFRYPVFFFHYSLLSFPTPSVFVFSSPRLLSFPNKPQPSGNCLRLLHIPIAPAVLTTKPAGVLTAVKTSFLRNQMQQNSYHWSEKSSVETFSEFQLYRSYNKFIEIKNEYL